MAIDKESIEERNDGLREGNKYYQAQVEYLSRSVDLSNTLLDTLKEELGIQSRRQTSEQNLLEINKKINKELINQRVGLNTISDIEKQITKNKKLRTATDAVIASLSNQISKEQKEQANQLAESLKLQKENQIQIDQINKELAEGNVKHEPTCVRRGPIGHIQSRPIRQPTLLESHNVEAVKQLCELGAT